MRAVAIEPAWYREQRLRVGQVFDFVEADARLNGDGIGFLPKWAVAEGSVAHAVFLRKQEQKANKFAEAAVHASGSKGHAVKKNSFVAAMRGEEHGDPRAAAAALAASGSEGAAQKKAARTAAEHEGRGPQTVPQ